MLLRRSRQRQHARIKLDAPPACYCSPDSLPPRCVSAGISWPIYYLFQTPTVDMHCFDDGHGVMWIMQAYSVINKLPEDFGLQYEEPDYGSGPGLFG